METIDERLEKLDRKPVTYFVKWWRASKAILLTVVFVFDSHLGTASGAELPAHEPIMIGVYAGSTFPADIETYTQSAGVPPRIVMWFQNWDEPLFYPKQMEALSRLRMEPMITWSPNRKILLPEINAGKYDELICRAAKAAADWKQPFFVRLMHEMNGTWQGFGPGVNGNTSEDFIRAWRHIVDLFRAAGAANVQWVWCPNVQGFGPSTAPFDPLYPGDAYVDVVGLDGYNFGPPHSPWRSAIEIFKASYDDLAQLTDRPIMICEWGCSEQGGDKAAWIHQSFLHDVPEQMPRIRALIVFSKKAEGDFRIQSSPSALDAYRDMAASPIYGSHEQIP